MADKIEVIEQFIEQEDGSFESFYHANGIYLGEGGRAILINLEKGKEVDYAYKKLALTKQEFLKLFPEAVK